MSVYLVRNMSSAQAETLRLPHTQTKNAKLTYKPGSVVDSHSSGMRVTTHLKRPTRTRHGPRRRAPIWPCSGWGLPSHRMLPSDAVRSYRTLSPLPSLVKDVAVCSLLHFP